MAHNERARFGMLGVNLGGRGLDNMATNYPIPSFKNGCIIGGS